MELYEGSVNFSGGNGYGCLLMVSLNLVRDI